MLDPNDVGASSCQRPWLIGRLWLRRLRCFRLRHQNSASCLSTGRFTVSHRFPAHCYGRWKVADPTHRLLHMASLCAAGARPEIPPLRTAVGGGGNPQQTGACVVSYDTKTTLLISPNVVAHFGWYAHFSISGKMVQRQF